MSHGRYYQHSGQFTFGGVVLTLVAGLAGGSILAAIYAALILYIPLAGFVTFLLAGGFGFLVGLVTSLLITAGKIRSKGLAFLLSSVVGLGSLYVAWAVWIFLLLNRAELEPELAAILLQPGVLWELLGQISEVGAWSMSDFTPTGLFLWFLWGVEAIIVLGLAMILPMVALATPFCERCDVWCNEEKDVATLKPCDPEELRARMEAKELGFLETVGKPEFPAAEWIRADLHVCPGCKEMQTLSFKKINVTVNDKGERSDAETNWIDHLLVTPQEAEAIRKLG